jgi:hypothetical protein
MLDSDFNTTAVKFEALGSTEIDSIVALIRSGRAVRSSAPLIRRRLATSYWIVVARTNSDHSIVGVSVLKRPDDDYRKKIFVSAKSPMEGFESAAELGYVTVAERVRGRGLAGRLVGDLATKLDVPTYATTGNDTMIRHLAEVGFRQVGSKWDGRDGKLSLLVTLP